MSVPIISHGATIAFSKSAFAATIVNVDGPNIDIAESDTSNQATALYVKENTPGLMDPGELTLEVIFDPDDILAHEPFSSRYIASGWSPATGETETVTVTWPKPYNKTTGAKAEFSGWIKSFSPTAAHGERMGATITVRISGPITWTASA